MHAKDYIRSWHINQAAARMRIQAAVECRHQNGRRDSDVLANTVREAWINLSTDTINRVFR
jgi:hypothetical protein